MRSGLVTSHASFSPFTKRSNAKRAVTIAVREQKPLLTQTNAIANSLDDASLNQQLDASLENFIKSGAAEKFLSTLSEQERTVAMVHPKEMYINISAADAFLAYVDTSGDYGRELKEFIHSQIETRTAGEMANDSDDPQKPLQPRFYLWLSGEKIGDGIEVIPTHGHVGETQFGDSSRCELMGVTPNTVLNVIFEKYNKLEKFWNINNLFKNGLVVSERCHIVPTGEMVRDRKIDENAHQMAFVPNSGLKELVETLPKSILLEQDDIKKLGSVLAENFAKTPITLQAYKALAGNAGAFVPKTDADPLHTKQMIIANFPKPQSQEMTQ